MDKLGEMLAILIQEGMDGSNPPIGFAGGPDLPFLKGKGPMRCTKMTLLAKVQNYPEIVEFDKHLPYGFLHVESAWLPPNSIVSIINRVDFLNAVNLEDSTHRDDMIVYVEYKQSPLFGRIMPKMFPLFEFSEVDTETGHIYSRIHGVNNS